MTRGALIRFAVVVATVALVVGAPQALAQSQAPVLKADDLAGTWEGVSKGTNGEVPVKVDLLAAGGKITGSINAPTIVVAVTDGKIEGGVLKLVLDAGGMAGTMTGKLVAPGKLEGTWEISSESGTIVMTKAGMAPAASASVASAGAVSFAGEWAGEAMVQGQAMPITLVIKVDGDSVSGEIQSAMGKTPFTSASCKDGLLSFSFPYAGGEPVSMGGKIIDGKLTGVFDYNSGEAQGTWWAAKK
jgi:hypothetical protein